jgi:Cd2+/Zn2+-exporting ATPase
VFDIAGMDCGDCARSVERVVGQLPGVNSAVVSFGAATLTVATAGTDSSLPDQERAITRAVDRAGYTALPRTGGRRAFQVERPWWKNRKLAPTAVALVLWLLAVAAQFGRGLDPLAITLYLGAILIGGFPIGAVALASLRVLRLDMNVLMSISVIGAVALGEWSEAGLVVVLFSIGTSLQGLTFERTRRAIRSLFDAAPAEARVLRDGVEVTVAVETLIPGDRIVVRPGERIPADGEIEGGQSAIVQAAITGESAPVHKANGDPVFAGTINGSGALTVRVTKRATETVLAGIVHLVEEAQASKAPSQQLVDRFSAIYTPAVVVLAALLAGGGYLFTNAGSSWLYRGLVLLVIACPCALVISTPVSIVSAIGAATRNGILVKGGAALEDMARITTLAMDKTGTLTLGRPVVTDVVPFDGHEHDNLLAVAAATERSSEHPLARAVIARALHDNVRVPDAQAFEALPGRGVQATVNGDRIVVGGERLLRETGASEHDLAAVTAMADQFAREGATALAVARVSPSRAVEVLGMIAVRDRLRAGVPEIVLRLRSAGIGRFVMLTGDRCAVAAPIAYETGIDEARADLLPAGKATAIGELRRYGPVAMIGDGVNDAPALASADVGIGMGLGGTDIALDSADVVLMRDDLAGLETIVRLSRRTVTVIRQNVALSLSTKVAALLLASFGFVSLWIAILVDVGTSLVVTLNGLRLARLEEQERLNVSAADATACGCGTEHEGTHSNAV